MAVGKKITDLTASGSLKDTDLAIVHDGNGTKRSTLTQLGEYIGTKISNPNLLINPNFKINQRGQAEYNNDGYTVDRWLQFGGKYTPSTKTVASKGAESSFTQKLENTEGGQFTISVKVNSIAGTVILFHKDERDNRDITLKEGINVFTFTCTKLNAIGFILAQNSSVQLDYIKLEQGLIATPFVAPNPSEELVKCARFLQVIPELYFVPYAITRTAFTSSGRHYQSTGGLFPVEMRTNPTIKHSAIHNANDEAISEKANSFGSNKYGIFFVYMGNEVDYYTLRVKKIIADAEIY